MRTRSVDLATRPPLRSTHNEPERPQTSTDQPSAEPSPQTPVTILAALIEDSWLGHDETLTQGDLAAIAETAVKAAVDIVDGQMDAFLDSPDLNQAWIAGWHSAVRHVAYALRKQVPPNA